MRKAHALNAHLVKGTFMSIVFADAPNNAEATIGSFLDSFVQGDFLNQMPEQARFDPSDVSITDGLQMYYLDADSVVSDQPLAKAVAGGWRYLLISGETAINDVCLDTGDDGKLGVVSTSIDTPMTQSTVVALQVAENDARTRASDYQARQLYYIDGNFCVALWLHATHDDLIIPMAPSMVSGSIELHKVYAAADFLTWLKTVATSAH